MTVNLWKSADWEINLKAIFCSNAWTACYIPNLIKIALCLIFMYSKVAESTHILPMKPLSKGVWEESSLILRGSSWKSLLTSSIHPFKICHKKQHPFPWGFIWKKFLLSLIWSFKNYWKNAAKFVRALFFRLL